MAATAAQTKSLGLAAPIGVLVAMLIAIAIFFTPMPFLTPPPTALPEIEKPKTVAAPPIIALPPPWTDLASSFGSLREPPPEVPTDPTKTDEPPKPTVAEMPSNWRYIGYIEEPRRLVAVVMIDTAQHLVAAGETIRDPNQPESKPVTVTSVAYEAVKVDYHGTEMTINLAQPIDPLESGALAPPSATGTPPTRQLGAPMRRQPPIQRPAPGSIRPPNRSTPRTGHEPPPQSNARGPSA